MKKLHNLQNYFFLLLILGVSLNLKAQNVSTDFADKMNDVFAGVDLNRVPHHLLTDYAMEFIDLKAYNGVVNDSNYVSKGIYKSAYNTLLMARTQTNVQDLVRPDQFYNNWQDEREAYTIALSGLYFKFSSFREDAHPDYINISDNKLYDKYVDGIWQNPYETHQVFMLAPPITSYNYKNMEVKLPENLWYSNQDAQVQSMAIDFNDGNGYQTLNFRESMDLSYESSGIYDWDYRLTLANGEILHSHSKVIIGDSPHRVPWSEHKN